MINLALSQAYNPRASLLLRGTKEKILIPPLSKGGLGGVKSQTAKQQSLTTFDLVVDTALGIAVSLLRFTSHTLSCRAFKLHIQGGRDAHPTRL